jgi:hypothetical protein
MFDFNQKFYVVYNVLTFSKKRNDSVYPMSELVELYSLLINSAKGAWKLGCNKLVSYNATPSGNLSIWLNIFPKLTLTSSLKLRLVFLETLLETLLDRLSLECL